MSMERDYKRGRNVTRTFCQKSKSVKKIKFKGKNAKRKREREKWHSRSRCNQRPDDLDDSSRVVLTAKGCSV
jgi:hypothetical protein